MLTTTRGAQPDFSGGFDATSTARRTDHRLRARSGKDPDRTVTALTVVIAYDVNEDRSRSPHA